ncbi:unnamed protein product [Effrenium voratum]|uniref:Uncharacterized protein n=1 Tax=Effrenium voratum TaxID=2562239 RepID=A0AA36HN38_9DINO|nr:unnamed protein product [Effrenium voratum]
MANQASGESGEAGAHCVAAAVTRQDWQEKEKVERQSVESLDLTALRDEAPSQIEEGNSSRRAKSSPDCPWPLSIRLVLDLRTLRSTGSLRSMSWQAPLLDAPDTLEAPARQSMTAPCEAEIDLHELRRQTLAAERVCDDFPVHGPGFSSHVWTYYKDSGAWSDGLCVSLQNPMHCMYCCCPPCAVLRLKQTLQRSIPLTVSLCGGRLRLETARAACVATAAVLPSL